MTDNVVINLGYGKWLISLYNPEVNIDIEGDLVIKNNLYVFTGDPIQVISGQHDYMNPSLPTQYECLGVFPKENIGACIHKPKAKTISRG